MTEDFKPVPLKDEHACEKKNKVEKYCNCRIPDDDVTGGSQCLPVPHSLGGSMKPEVKRLALLHYQTKSREDFEVKMKRGGGNSKWNPKKPWLFEKAMEYAFRHSLLQTRCHRINLLTLQLAFHQSAWICVSLLFVFELFLCGTVAIISSIALLCSGFWTFGVVFKLQ